MTGVEVPPPWRGVLPVGGLEVHAVGWGAADGRAPVGDGGGRWLLLLHGLGGTSLHWELAGGRLAEHRRAVVTAIDLAGFGRTRARSEQATVAANARLVVALLERHGPAELVANSMGGAVAMIVAAGHAELVTRLVLVTSVLPQPPWPEPPLPLLPHNWPAAVPGAGPLLVRAYAQAAPDERVVDDRLRRSFFDMRRVDAGIRARMIELTRERRAFAEGPAAYAAAARSMFWYVTDPEGSARDVARIRCPTLIVHGQYDRLVPLRLAEAALRRRPDWRLRVMPRCGHMPQLELPEDFVAACAEAG